MMAKTALRVQRALDDLNARRARAEAMIQSLTGRLPTRLVSLFEEHPNLSAKDCASALGRTATQTTQILKAFENRSLIVEVTGHKRFRFWKANV